MKAFAPRAFLFVVALAAAQLARASAPEPRARLLLDFGWRFHLGNEWGIGQSLAKAGTGYGPAGETFSDLGWRTIDLPHDWAIELPFEAKADGAHGFRAVGAGFPENSIGWYRRSFELSPADTRGRIWLEFDGVFRDCTVFVNGWFVGHHEGGYNGFRYDITDVAKTGGPNTVAVRVDASQFEGWFYEGAGIYRHVWLVKTGPLAIAPDGVFVFSRFPGNVPEGPAEIHLEAKLRNADPAPADATVTWEIFDPSGHRLASATQAGRIGGSASLALQQSTALAEPQLWSPEHPALYTLVTTVSRGGDTADRIQTEFGVRTVAFDANKGFLLNGQPYEIKGTCNHQDHAGVGSALLDQVQYFRVAQLKKMGSNGYRTAHNPPTPELLEACDRLGMLVMDENRLVGSDAQNLERWEEQIRRDRNHPSVVVWSLANEEFTVQSTPAGGRAAATMQAFVKRLDPTRPVTYNAPLGNEFDGINQVIEVRGWSYHIGAENMDAYHAAHPQQPNVGSEQGSTVGTRGIYTDDKVRGYMSAYDDHGLSWSNTAEEWWSFFDHRPWLSGGFVWTGFDYRGEPTPYGWPCINSHFGILDTCGYPKDNFWYYQAWWTPQPVLHLLPHWNWRGKEGQVMDVRALSNCAEVELYLNGRSVGRQPMSRDSELKWKVPYAPGTLSAKGYNAGQVVAETKVETTGEPAEVRLEANRTEITANGEDCAVIRVSVFDDRGRVVPVAANSIAFDLAGPGRIVGVGNGDPSSHEPDVFVSTPTFHTAPVGGWRWQKVADTYAAGLPEKGATFDDAAWASTEVTGASGSMGPMERGVFRTHLTVTAQDLAAPGIELWFGKIEGDGSVYLNGQKIGAGGDPRAASVYDVTRLLHPGNNTIAVALTNWGATAGISQGVQLRYLENPPAVAWHRSVFNGLAEIIVRAGRATGPVTLTARSAGLRTATLTLQAGPATATVAFQ